MRVLCFIILVCATLTLPWWLTVVLWAGYLLLVRGGYEVIVLAVCLDAYASTDTFSVTYTLIAVLLYVLMAWLRPRVALSDAAM